MTHGTQANTYIYLLIINTMSQEQTRGLRSRHGARLTGRGVKVSHPLDAPQSQYLSVFTNPETL